MSGEPLTTNQNGFPMIRTYPTTDGYRKIAVYLHKTGVTAVNVAATLKAVNYQIRLGDTVYNVKYDIVENLLNLLEWQAANNNNITERISNES